MNACPFPLWHQWFVSLIYSLLWRSSFQEKHPTLLPAWKLLIILVPHFGFCMFHVVFKVWEVLRFIPFLTEYWHLTLMKLFAHFSMVIVSSKPTTLHAMLNSHPPSLVHDFTFIYRTCNLYFLVTQSCKVLFFFFSGIPHCLYLSDYPNSDQEYFSPILIKSHLWTWNRTDPRKGLCRSPAAMSFDRRNWKSNLWFFYICYLTFYSILFSLFFIFSSSWDLCNFRW